MLVRLSVGTFGGASALPILVAISGGSFGRAGLEVERSVTTDSGRLRAELAGGDIAIAHLAPDNIIAWADDGDPVSAWLGGSAGPISLVSRVPGGVEGLRGHRIGVDSPRSGFAPILTRLLERAGVDIAEVELVSLGATRLRYAALTDGRIEATMLTVPWSELARRAGAEILADHTDVAPGLLTSCAASRLEWLRGEATTAAAYADALDAAVAWLRQPANQPEAAALLSDDAGLEPDVAADVITTMLEPAVGWPRTSRLRGAELQATWELRAAAVAPPGRPAAAYVEVLGGR